MITSDLIVEIHFVLRLFFYYISFFQTYIGDQFAFFLKQNEKMKKNCFDCCVTINNNNNRIKSKYDDDENI